MQVKVDYDYADMRRLGTRNQGKKWYEEFCRIWDTQGAHASQAFIRSLPPVFEKLKQISTVYKPGKPGQAFNRHELYALREPNKPNVCGACGNLVGYDSVSKDWFTGCSRQCAALACVPKRQATCMDRYGENNPSKVTTFQEKREASNMKRFGVCNAFQSEKIKRRIKKTNIVRYGAENPSQNEEVHSKKVETMLKNFGHEHWTKAEHMKHKLNPFDAARLEKSRRTMLERYGVDNPLKSPEVRDRILQTNLSKYGVSNPGIFSAYKRKRYVDRFGKQHMVQGYEPKVLEILDYLKSVIRVETKIKKVPTFNYSFGGKRRKYYPDIIAYTKTTAHVIEVKSDFTLKVQLDQNLQKFKRATKQCNKKGRTFWLYCFVEKELIRVKNPKSLHDLRKAGLPV